MAGKLLNNIFIIISQAAKPSQAKPFSAGRKSQGSDSTLLAFPFLYFFCSNAALATLIERYKTLARCFGFSWGWGI